MKKLLLLLIFCAAMIIAALAQKVSADKPSQIVNVVSCETGKTVLTRVKRCDVPVLLDLFGLTGKYYLVPTRKKDLKKPANLPDLQAFFLPFLSPRYPHFTTHLKA